MITFASAAVNKRRVFAAFKCPARHQFCEAHLWHGDGGVLAAVNQRRDGSNEAAAGVAIRGASRRQLRPHTARAGHASALGVGTTLVIGKEVVMSVLEPATSTESNGRARLPSFRVVVRGYDRQQVQAFI